MRLREIIARLRDRLNRDKLSAELDEEIRLHRELLARDARSAHADRSFGHATYYKEETRAMWSLGLFDDLLHDLRYASRVLRRDFGFTAAVVLTLALGIGANTAAFSIVNAVLLRDLPYADPSRLVTVWTSPISTPSARNPASLPDVRDWEKQSTSVFGGIAGFASNRFDINLPGGDVQARAVCAAGNVYEVLGARPLLGRMPRGDEEAIPVLAISHRLWIEHFAGDPGVLGKVVNLNHEPYTIVGVMPPGFNFPSPDYEMWTTLASIHSGSPNSPWLTSRSLHGYKVVARLAPGVTLTRAEREMNLIEERLGAAYPSVDDGTDIHVQSLRDDTVGKVQRGLWTVFGAAALILLLACVNVAHLLLARLSARDREIAVRRALGAHRGRVVRQLITESVLLGVLGGVAGLAVALGMMRALMRFNPGDIPRLENVNIDGPTLAFALVLSLVTGLLFGVLPAVLGWGNNVHDTLRAKGSVGLAGGRTRAVLTGLEVAFAVMLVVGATLMLRSFSTLTSTKLGVVTTDVAIAQTTFVGPRYATNEAKTRAVESVVSNLRAIPGVTVAGASTSMPPSRIQESEGFEITGQPAAEPGHERMAIFIPATSGYLEALRIPIERGRSFDARDDASSPKVVVVSAELVKRYFSGVDPIGRQIDVNGETRTIVGVSGDAVYQGVGSETSPVIYVPFAQFPFPGVWIAIRSSRDAASLSAQVRDAIRRVDSDLPTHRVIPLDDMVGESVVRPRFHAWLLGMFGGLALLLASIGIYGVVAYGVAQRRPEIGIRLALGAPSGSVVGMVLRSAMTPVVIGILAGLGAAYVGSRLISGLLYGIAATDVTSFVVSGVALALAGLVAALLPARRAASVDPLAAIRAE